MRNIFGILLILNLSYGLIAQVPQTSNLIVSIYLMAIYKTLVATIMMAQFQEIHLIPLTDLATPILL